MATTAQLRFISRCNINTEELTLETGQHVELVTMDISYQPGQGMAPVQVPQLCMSRSAALQLLEGLQALLTQHPAQSAPSPGGH